MASENEVERFDVAVFGASAGGVMAAVAAARRGARTALVDPTGHVGGMMTGGLTRSDVERQEDLIGGLARELFESFGPRYSPEHRWRFEPGAAEETLRAWLDHHGVRHLPSWDLADLSMHGGAIVSLRTRSGERVEASVFIDASYEGDLLAAAGASYHVGRDGRERYGEVLAGRSEILPNPHQFLVPVSAVEGDGLLPGVYDHADIGDTGDGDGKLQSYCYRVCLTDDPDNRVPIEAPADYDPSTYELARRYLGALGDDATLRNFMGIGSIPNDKFDINSGGPVSTSLLGGSFDYPDATPERRAEVARQHRSWAQGLLFYLGNDEAVPAHVRQEMQRYGLPGDEFIGNDHWPPQLYVRDARRLLGEHVLTEHDLRPRERTEVPDAVGLGGYNIDIREVQWVAAPIYRFPDVFPEVMTEGYVSYPVDPYAVPYRSLLPRRNECTNLLVSTCVSSSHVAFASFRMESQFMIAGHAAGVAAALASGDEGVVHDVDVETLQRLLREEGQILDLPAR